MKQLKGMTPMAVKEVEADMVFNKIKTMPVWEQSQHILCYWSLPDELPTHEVVNQWLADGKNIYLPRVMPGAHHRACSGTRPQAQPSGPGQGLL